MAGSITERKMIYKIFSLLWRKRLGDDKLIKVTGWRSALIETKYGNRYRITFCIFPWD